MGPFIDRILRDSEGTHRCFLARCHSGPLHPQWELRHRDPDLLHLSCPMQGVLDYRVDGSKIPLKPGDFLVVAPGVPHGARHRGRARALTCRIGFRALKGGKSPFSPGELPGMHVLGNDPGGHLREVLVRLISRHLQAGESSHPAAPPGQREGDETREVAEDHGIRYALGVIRDALARERAPRADGRILALRDFLEGETGTRFTLEDLSDRCGLSAKYLARAFRSAFGASPTAYHLRRRLHRGRHLLEETPLKVESVAAACGFPDTATFSHAYRRLFGETPRVHRRPPVGIPPPDGKFHP